MKKATVQPVPTLYKSIFQVRYDAKLEFLQTIYSAALAFEEIPHWQATGPRVTLFDFDKHCSIGISHDSFSYSQDSGDLQLESKYQIRCMEVLPSLLRISNFTRFGLRRWYLIPISFSFEALTAILDLKLTAQDEKLHEILPHTANDLTYIMSRSEGDYTARIVIAPARKEEVPSLVPYDKQHHLQLDKRDELFVEIKHNYPDVSVLLEIDYFQLAKKLSLEDAAVFRTTASNRISRLVTKLNDYFFSTKVEL